MRIAFVTLQYPPGGVGGIGTYVRAVATALAGDGHEVTVVVVDGDRIRSTTDEDGVRVERIPSLGPSWLRERLVRPRQTSRVRVHAAVSAALALRRLGARFDVVEAPEWKAQGLLLRLARRGRVVVHIHLPLELEDAWNGKEPSRGRRLAHRLERWTATRADARTATSRRSVLGPDDAPWLPEADVEIVPPPLRVSAWADVPPASGTTPTVLFVGRLERRKAPELLVEALARVAADVPGLRAVFVGRVMRRGEQPYDELLRQLAAAQGLTIEIRPPVASEAEMSAMYTGARVVAVPSTFETLSMVALEALACGRPAVMTDHVGAAEWIGGALPELVVPSGDAAALADALRPHLSDPDHAERIGERGRRLVGELCSDRRVVDGRLSVYRSVSGPDSGRW